MAKPFARHPHKVCDCCRTNLESLFTKQRTGGHEVDCVISDLYQSIEVPSYSDRRSRTLLLKRDGRLPECEGLAVASTVLFSVPLRGRDTSLALPSLVDVEALGI